MTTTATWVAAIRKLVPGSEALIEKVVAEVAASSPAPPGEVEAVWEMLVAHATFGWNGDQHHACRCGAHLNDKSWADPLPAWARHVTTAVLASFAASEQNTGACGVRDEATGRRCPLQQEDHDHGHIWDLAARLSTSGDTALREAVAEVEHWKAHAEEAGRGFGEVCKNYARVAARNTALREAVERTLSEKRIRHDHGYPMEVGPHHCDGCDLIADLRALLNPTPPTDTGGDA